MGWGRAFRCRECGCVEEIYLGSGFYYPEMYEMAEHKITSGKCGQEFKELFEKTPGAATNADKRLHVCGECGSFNACFDQSIYAPKEPGVTKLHTEPYSQFCPAVGQEYATPDEIKFRYRLVKEYVYKCQRCGSPMHPYNCHEKLRCPACGKIAFEEINAYVHWN